MSASVGMSSRLIVVACLLSICHADDRLANDAHADRVLVFKKERTLVLLDHGKILKKYKISLGADPTGLKNRQGDHKTPEGIYILDRRNEHSHFYRSLHISYPNAAESGEGVEVRRRPWRGHHASRLAQRLRLARQHTSPSRLDRRLHRCYQRRDGRDLEGSCRRYAD